MRITKRQIDAAIYPESFRANEAFYLWDTLRGFGVRIYPSGLKKFVIRYTNIDGTRHFLTLGPCNVLSVEEARKMALVRFAYVLKGGDPAEDKAAKRQRQR